MLTRRSVLLSLLATACGGRTRYSVATAPTGPNVVPLGFVGTLPTVPVVVGGRRIDVLLDLGGFDTLSLAPNLALGRPTGRTRTFHNARGEPMEAREIVLPEVRLGELVLRDVHGYEHVFAPDFPPPVQAGYIGRGILDRLALAIDYPSRQVTLAASRTQLPASARQRWELTPFQPGDVGAVVSATLDGRQRALLLDTGATTSFLRPDAMPDRRASYHARELRIGRLALGPLDFAALDLAVPGVHGFLGANFFQSRRVLVDAPGAVVGLEVA